MNDVLKESIQPKTDVQWIIFAFLAFGAGIFYLWLRFGRDKAIDKAVDDRFNQLTHKEFRNYDKKSDGTRTDLFKAEQTRGLAAVGAKLEAIERHYERNFDKIDNKIESIQLYISQLKMETEMLKNTILGIKEALNDKNDSNS
jgi:hypothetical protein